MTISCLNFHPCRSIRTQILPCHKNGQVNPGSSFESVWKNLSTRCCIPSFKAIGLLVPKEGIFQGFFHNMSLDAILVMLPGIFEHIVIPNIPWSLHIKFGFNIAWCILRKRNLKMLNLSDLGQSQWMTLTLGCHKSSYTHLFDYMYLQASTVTQTSTVEAFSPYRSKRDQIWPCCKIGQGQPKVIIWTNLVVLEYLNQCCRQSFKATGLLVPDKKIFKCFYHIWAWRPSWSCDINHLNSF